MARFNEQIEPIYVLLRETEDVNLSHDLLEPEPTEIPALKQRSVSENVFSIGLCFYTTTRISDVRYGDKRKDKWHHYCFRGPDCSLMTKKEFHI